MQKPPFKIKTAEVDPTAGMRTRTPKTEVIPGVPRRTVPDRLRLRNAPYAAPPSRDTGRGKSKA